MEQRLLTTNEILNEVRDAKERIYRDLSCIDQYVKILTDGVSSLERQLTEYKATTTEFTEEKAPV